MSEKDKDGQGAHHPTLQGQLDDLGIDLEQPLPPDQLARLLDVLDTEYKEADYRTETLYTVLDTLRDTTCHVDENGILVGMNDRGPEFFQTTPDTMMRKELMTTVHLEDGAGRRLTTADLDQDSHIDQGHVVLSNGHSFACSISISRIAQERGFHGAVVLLRDVAQRVEREEALQEARVEVLVARQAEQAKGSFLANMSHELRTPLNAIIGYSEMLWEEAELEGRGQHSADLRRIMVAGHHLMRLIGGILDLSKIEAGRMELFFELADVSELAREVVDTLRHEAEVSGLQLEILSDEGTPAVRADVTRLRQCLFNLVSNAVKFTDEGKVTVKVEGDSNEVRVLVTDSGIGISQSNIERLFTDFTQADVTTTKRFGGTGLGLAVSRRLCGMMGGDITVTSELGVGSTFTLALPGQLTPSIPTTTVTPDRTTVLVIDDDYAVRELLERMLKREGYAVVTASNGRSGLSLAEQFVPGAIVLDVRMPDIDGWSVLAALKASEKLRNVPVVLLTVVEERGRGYALGASEYLNKPVDRTHLLAVLRRICDTETGTALIVEDDLESRHLVVRTLSMHGWRVLEAENGKVALEVLNGETPDVILLDLMMPEMDGFEFLDRLRLRPDDGHLPVVVMTAMELTAAERAELDRSVQRVVKKGSIGRRELVEELRSRLGARNS